MTLETNYPKCSCCTRPMRPRGYTAQMAPGTVATSHNGQCKSCALPAREPKPRTERKLPVRQEESLRLAHMVRGLEAFYARRYARGVQPEPTPSIMYARTAAPIPARHLQLVESAAAGQDPVRELEAA